MAEAERFFLADVGNVDHVGDGAHDLEQIGLLALLQHFFQFVADIEVIFDGLFAAAGDDDDLVAAGGERFFHAVLDDRFIHQRQHFFGLGFGGGQEARAQSGGGKDGFANSHGHRGSMVSGQKSPPQEPN